MYYQFICIIFNNFLYGVIKSTGESESVPRAFE